MKPGRTLEVRESSDWIWVKMFKQMEASKLHKRNRSKTVDLHKSSSEVLPLCVRVVSKAVANKDPIINTVAQVSSLPGGVVFGWQI